jgi:hypothetical protein
MSGEPNVQIHAAIYDPSHTDPAETNITQTIRATRRAIQAGLWAFVEIERDQMTCQATHRVTDGALVPLST